VEVMISVPFVVPDAPLGVSALEERVEAWGRQVMRQAMAAAWAAQAALRPVGSCPACGAGESRPAGVKARQVETVFGAVTLPRQRRWCAGCGKHYQPDDAVLVPELGAGRLSPHLRELTVQCGASWPYRQAAEVLGRLRGVPLSAETVRAVVGTIGTRVASTQAQAAATAVAPPATAPEMGRAVPDRIEVELDGAWVHSHDTAHGIEVKVGVVHGGSVAVGSTRRELTQRTYAATAQGVAVFGPLLTAAIEARNGFAAVLQTLLGDGAAWIWRLGDELLPDATRVLDRWHLTDARRRALRAALPDKTLRAPWSVRLEERLEQGDVAGAVAVLDEVAALAPHPALTEFAGYVTTLAPCIPNYAARRAAGERIGSGGVEKGVDVVVNRRLKGRRGMRWWRQRIEGLVALRLALLNGAWDRLVPPTLTAHQLPAS
jgi:Uncharacterised protein family (UPF0236)